MQHKLYSAKLCLCIHQNYFHPGVWVKPHPPSLFHTTVHSPLSTTLLQFLQFLTGLDAFFYAKNGHLVGDKNPDMLQDGFNIIVELFQCMGQRLQSSLVVLDHITCHWKHMLIDSTSHSPHNVNKHFKR